MGGDDDQDRLGEPATPPDGSAEAGTPEDVPRSRGRIVVVDDEPHLAFLVRVVLEHAGYLVAEAPHGEVALQLVAAASTQLVVTDRMMPVMNGPALVARLRADPETASIPIVMVSSNPDAGAAVDAFLDKPFEPDELVKLVDRLISATDKGAPS